MSLERVLLVARAPPRDAPVWRQVSPRGPRARRQRSFGDVGFALRMLLLLCVCGWGPGIDCVPSSHGSLPTTTDTPPNTGCPRLKPLQTHPPPIDINSRASPRQQPVPSKWPPPPLSPRRSRRSSTRCCWGWRRGTGASSPCCARSSPFCTARRYGWIGLMGLGRGGSMGAGHGDDGSINVWCVGGGDAPRGLNLEQFKSKLNQIKPPPRVRVHIHAHTQDFYVTFPPGTPNARMGFAEGDAERLVRFF